MGKYVRKEKEYKGIIKLGNSNLLNLRVKHKLFGAGIVTDVSGNCLTVKFATKESKFVFPDSFEKFLVAEDASIQAEILKRINDAKIAAEEQRQKEDAARKLAEERHAAEKQEAFATKELEDGFGPDYNVEHLAKQPVFTYQQVEKQFGIRIAGFGRGINRTASAVVLISSVDKKKTGFVYHDHWTTDGDYIYSGEGKNGDQHMTLGNKAIADAKHDGKTIHLLVKFSPQEYYYQGIFCLVDYTYEDEKDEFGNVRKEYKFRLRRNPAKA